MHGVASRSRKRVSQRKPEHVIELHPVETVGAGSEAYVARWSDTGEHVCSVVREDSPVVGPRWTAGDARYLSGIGGFRTAQGAAEAFAQKLSEDNRPRIVR